MKTNETWSDLPPLLDRIMAHNFKKFCLTLAALALPTALSADEPSDQRSHVKTECDTSCDKLACDELPGTLTYKKNCGLDFRYRTPAMLGDFFGGSPMGFRADAVLDRAFVVADDLDAPLILPPLGSTVTITEPGPIGIFSSPNITSVQQLQALFRAAAPIPPLTLRGVVGDNATLTSIDTVGQIQAQLVGTPLAYDIVRIQAPPASYNAAVANALSFGQPLPGTVVYNSNASGAMLQGGVDTLNGGEDFDAFYFYDYVIRFNTALTDATSGGVGRTKIADGGTILPQNRFFFRYNNIQNVGYTNTGANLNRFTPGFERSFLKGLGSLELRAPFATDASTAYTLDNGSVTNGTDTRFGNLTLYAKALLHQSEQFAVSGGLGVALPTAKDITVNFANGTSLLQVRNESVHLQPFLGALFTPNNRFFAQGFVQYDATASGNTVAINSTGSGLQNVGTLTDSNNIFVDGGIGYWLYQNNTGSGLTGVIPTLEVHQTNSVQNGDFVTAGPFQVGNFNGSTNMTSVVAGSTLEFGGRSQLSAGYAAPLGGGADRQYDGAFQFNFNRFLGP